MYTLAVWGIKCLRSPTLNRCSVNVTSCDYITVMWLLCGFVWLSCDCCVTVLIPMYMTSLLSHGWLHSRFLRFLCLFRLRVLQQFCLLFVEHMHHQCSHEVEGTKVKQHQLTQNAWTRGDWNLTCGREGWGEGRGREKRFERKYRSNRKRRWRRGEREGN